MSLKLYNTLTRRKEEFAPIDPADVRMYVCGPTVYDYAHIGNARPVIVFDVLFRLLRHVYGADHVTYVRNITDVDDKINDRAARDYPDLPLNDAIRKVTEATAAQFHADIKALGVLEPTHEPRATEHIEGMKAIIERLVAGGFAYVAEGHVLFSPAAMDAAGAAQGSPLPRYGALANRTLDEMIAGARVDVAPYKRDSTDFVLWKPSAPGVPGWPSPCGIPGLGRPGWHIECSAMSQAFLGETFDIHGGGIDLVFPHHENEIAQSTCAFGRGVMANVWMHNGFLQVEGEKMSKSLGNFVTINELLETETFGGRKWPGEVLRLAMLKTHYRQPIDWTVKALEEAEQSLQGWYRRISKMDLNSMHPVVPSEIMVPLLDDLNTAGAIGVIHSLANEAEQSIEGGGRFLAALNMLGLIGGVESLRELRRSARDVAGFTRAVIRPFLDTLVAKGFGRAEMQAEVEFLSGRLADAIRSENPDLPISDAVRAGFERLESWLDARLAARRAKNFAESDRIRDELAAMGIQLKDGKDPATGEPTTTWDVKR